MIRVLLCLQWLRSVWYPGSVGAESGMRRRPRRTANNSESTGKIGQELPQNQPRPLVPLYPDETLPGESRSTRPPVAPQEPRAPRAPAAVSEARTPRPAATPHEPRAPRQPSQPKRPAPPEWNEPAGSGRLEMETQPESPSVPSAEAQAASRSPQAPKGYVVLAIGLP